MGESTGSSPLASLIPFRRPFGGIADTAPSSVATATWSNIASIPEKQQRPERPG